MATLIQRWNRNVKSTTSSRRWYYVVVHMLRQLCEESKIWTNNGQMVTFPQPFFKIYKNMIFSWYAGSILWHQTQSIISLSQSKSSQKLLLKSLETLWMINWSQTETFQEELARFRFFEHFKNNFFERWWCNKSLSENRNKDFQLN